jgi:hypothetical protein
VQKKRPKPTLPAPLAYVYINDQEELFDTDIEKHSAQGDECRARNRLSELSNMTVSSRLPSNIPHTSIRLCA